MGTVEAVTHCPVLVTDDERGVVPCGEELQATRRVDYSFATISISDDRTLATLNWGSPVYAYDWGEAGRDGLGDVYCRNDHSENEILSALLGEEFDVRMESVADAVSEIVGS